MSDNFNKNRILKNTVLLYVRMLFTMWLNLWATRLVLQNLGVEDMGVYGVVGSIVSMISVITGGITTAIQRFITYELGRPNGKVNLIICSSLNVIFAFSVILIVLLETIGIAVLNHSLNIPEASRETAFWVYQLSVFTCIINLISIPYNALIIAHEKMDAFAIISIVQVVLNCAAAYCLTYFADGRLLAYGVSMAVASLLVRLLYQAYCRISFPVSAYHFIYDKGCMLQLLKFTGISTTSGILQMITSQGITFVINWTFGVALNAVYAIALQLKNMVLSFSFNIFKAISPQITKTYAEGDYETHKKLVYTGSKIEVYMIYFILIPFLFRTEYIMKLWLGNVPEYAVSFAQCTIFISLTYAAFEPIRTAVMATNRIAKFMLIPDAFNILVLPAAYITARVMESPNLMIVTIVGFDIFTCVIRLWYGSRVSEISVRETINKIVMRSLTVAFLSSLFCYMLVLITEETISGLILLIGLESIVLLFTICLLGLDRSERSIIVNIIKSKKTKQ